MHNNCPAFLLPLSTFRFDRIIICFACMLEKGVKDLASHEFVSDYLQASSKDLDEVQEGMKKLALGSVHKGKAFMHVLYV